MEKIRLFVNNPFNKVPYMSTYARIRKIIANTGEFNGKVIDTNFEKEAIGLLLIRHPFTRLYSSWSNRFSDKNAGIHCTSEL